MPFRSKIKRHADYFTFRAILMDTCALTCFAQRPTGAAEFDAIMMKYRVLVPPPVLYEFAFGLPGTVGAAEALLRKRLFVGSKNVEMVMYPHLVKVGQLTESDFSIVNPSFNEWWIARDHILNYAAVAGAKVGKSKQTLSMDALIRACARNCFVPVCTVNRDDFERLNRACVGERSWEGTVPVYSPQQVLDSMISDVWYDEAAAVDG